jgi:hypothetical protein
LIVLSSACAIAAPPDVHRDDAARIVFPTDLRADIDRPGDTFFANVDHDPLLPDGSRLYGRIVSVHMATPRRPASMDMEFNILRTPDGHRWRIEAVPMPLNDPHLSRGTSGRLVASYKPGERGQYVVGGAVGGLVVGSLVHRPLTGTLIGAIIGSIAGHEDQRRNQNLVVSKGEHFAAVFLQDVADFSPPPLRDGDASSGWRNGETARHGSPPPPSDSGIDIRNDGDPLIFDSTIAPYRDGNVVMVPVDRTASQLQLDVTRHSDGRITIEGPEASLEMRADSVSYSLDNGKSGELPHAVVNHEGTLYAPIEAFALVKTRPITVNGKKVG